MKYTIRLNNSILGWMLVPVSEGSEAVLNQLYLDEDWTKMKPSDRAFMKDDSIEKVIAHIKEVCKDMKMGVSFCGKPANPTIHLWWNPVVAVKPEELNVDLKWACWSADEGHWNDYAPDGAWERIKQAFLGTAGPVTINTGPRKEIRFGSVTISKGHAEGYFCTEWDGVEELADTLGTEPDDAFREMIPFTWRNMEPGHEWDFKVKARSFQRLMERIDKEEHNLLVHDEREWKYIKDCFQPK